MCYYWETELCKDQHILAANSRKKKKKEEATQKTVVITESPLQ